MSDVDRNKPAGLVSARRRTSPVPSHGRFEAAVAAIRTRAVDLGRQLAIKHGPVYDLSEPGRWARGVELARAYGHYRVGTVTFVGRTAVRTARTVVTQGMSANRNHAFLGIATEVVDQIAGDREGRSTLWQAVSRVKTAALGLAGFYSVRTPESGVLAGRFEAYPAMRAVGAKLGLSTPASVSVVSPLG